MLSKSTEAHKLESCHIMAECLKFLGVENKT